MNAEKAHRQPELCPLDSKKVVAVSTPAFPRAGQSKRERLSSILQTRLDFHTENSRYASHDLHAFAAKFPPQLPRTFIRELTDPGEIVLDPMMGSGTTIVEAIREGRRAIGLDLDPLALYLGQTKTSQLDRYELEHLAGAIIVEARNRLNANGHIDQLLQDTFDTETKAFIDYWFFPQTQRELMALVSSISCIPDTHLRRFFELTFSSIIITKSGGVSRARDLAHSRPHRDQHKKAKCALEQFAVRARKNIASISQLEADASATIIAGDARLIPLADNSIDLIVTSPPYANAIDYMRAHKFSLVWFEKSIRELSELRAHYIGSERIGPAGEAGPLPQTVERIIGQVEALDKKKARILCKYFSEMRQALAEMWRVLRQGSPAVVVIGSSTTRGIVVPTHHCLAATAAELGFDVVGIAERQLDRNKRMLPARFHGKTDSMIEQRMHHEYVIGLLRPE